MVEKKFFQYKSGYILISIILLIIYVIGYLCFACDYSIGLSQIKPIAVLIILQFAFTIFSWYRITGALFDAYLVFTLVFFVFNLSQPVIEMLGCAVEFRRLWGGGYGISNKLYFMATCYSLAAANVFHIGAILSLRNKSKNNSLIVNRLLYLRVLRKTAVAFCVISGPFYLYNLVQELLIVQTLGYNGLYEIESSSRGVEIVAGMFEPAMLAFFCTSMLLNLKKKTSGLLIILTMFIPPLVLGGRSNAMLVLAIIFIVISCTRKINIRKFSLFFAIGICMLFLMNIIAETRTDSGRSYKAIAEAGRSSENPIISTIQEMGWSLYPLALTIEAIPDKKDYDYGTSFFWAGISLIPNIGFWNGEHPGKKNDPAEWLNRYSKESYGIGYSMTAGTYNEFGILGLVLMFVYGVVFCRIFANVSSCNALKKPIKFIFALIFLWFAIKFVRNSLTGISRGLVYYMLPLAYITKIMYRKNILNKLRH